MAGLKKVMQKIIQPPTWVIILLIPVSVLLLCLAFDERYFHTWVGYIGYFVSAYTLTVTIVNFKRIITNIKEKFWSNKLIVFIDSIPIGHMFLNDVTFRGAASIYQGLVMNTIYALFRGITAIKYQSIWFAAIAIYYALLGSVRMYLARSIVKRVKIKDSMKRAEFEHKSARMCGFLMLILNIGIAGMMVLVIRDNMHYEYPGYVIYLSALYTFYMAISAFVKIFKFKKMRSPILSASKTLALSGAMMSIMALQTALIARFGGDDNMFRLTANTVTGSMVCLITIISATFIICIATKNLSKLKSESA